MKLNLIAALALAAPAAAFAENVWTYYAANAADNPTNQGDAGTISNEACIANSDWTIGVERWAPATGTIRLGHVFIKDGDDTSAGKVLDLRGVTVVDAADGTRTVVTSLAIPGNMASWKRAPILELYADSLANPIESSILGARAAADANKCVRRIELAGDAVQQMNGETFYNCTSLTNLVLHFPNCISYGRWTASNCPITNDVTELVSPAVGEIGQTAFGGYVTGSLVITNHTGSIIGIGYLYVTNLYVSGPYSGNGSNWKTGAGGNGILSDQIFRGMGTIETLTLKWPNVRNLNSNYAYLQNLREFTIDMPAITNVLANMFSSATRLETLTMLGVSVPTNVVDELLKAVPSFAADAETATKSGVTRGRAILYCSKKQGWKALAKPLTAGTYEKEHAPADCFGVWETAAGERKAWMVHLPQDTDPRTGAIIVVR